jgi:hypothetical protein
MKRKAECNKCGDYHTKIVLDIGIFAECKQCGNRWVLICPKCSSVVSTTQDRVNSSGASYTVALCACGHTGSGQWNVLTRKRSNATHYARRSGSACAHCGGDGGGKPLEVDHKVALCNGGKDIMNNMQLLCQDCHKSKTQSDLRRSSMLPAVVGCATL